MVFPIGPIVMSSKSFQEFGFQIKIAGKLCHPSKRGIYLWSKADPFFLNIKTPFFLQWIIIRYYSKTFLKENVINCT